MSDALIIGCGYLGRCVAARWLAQGRRVFAVTRSRADELRRVGIEPIVADVLDPNSLRQLPPAAIVLHAVGLDRSADYPMRELYVKGLANVLTALPAAGRFVYVSSTGVYGQTGGRDVDESAATEPPEESGQIVLEAERLLRSARRDAIVLRFAGIYGPGRLLRQAAIASGQPIAGDPEAWLNLIHVDDGAAVVVAAAECAGPGETYNVADDRPVRRREFYTHLAELLGAPLPVFVTGADCVNRRVINRRMRDRLGVALEYPDCVAGLAAIRE